MATRRRSLDTLCLLRPSLDTEGTCHFLRAFHNRTAVPSAAMKAQNFCGIQPYQLAALSLSLAAHFALSVALGKYTNGDRDAASGQDRKSGFPLVFAYFMEPKSADIKPIPELSDADNAKQFPAPSVKHVMQDMPKVLPVPQPDEPYYFPVRELTEKPHVVQDISPNLEQMLTGVPTQTAVLRLLINERGSVDRAIIEQSYFPEHVAQLIVDAFSKIRFRPGRIDDIPVKSQLKVEFRLESIPAIP